MHSFFSGALDIERMLYVVKSVVHLLAPHRQTFVDCYCFMNENGNTRHTITRSNCAIP